MTTIRHAIAGSAGLVLLALSAVAGAQSAPPVVEPSTRGEWTLGVGAVAIDSPYAGEGSRLRPVPLLGFDGEHAFVRGTAAGVHLLQSQGVTLDAIVSVRLDGVEIDDLGRGQPPARRTPGQPAAGAGQRPQRSALPRLQPALLTWPPQPRTRASRAFATARSRSPFLRLHP